MEEFIGGLTRDLRYHVYAAQGAVGPHPDMQLMGLNKALGVLLVATDANVSEYRAEFPAWRSPATRAEPAVLRLVRNGCDRDHTFPETWSKWVLCCDIAPAHCEELEQRLWKSDFRWVLLHAPPRRLLEAGGGSRTEGGQAGTAVATPVVIEVPQDVRVYRWIQIVDTRGGRVVTVIEILSPWNMEGGRGTTEYVENVREYLSTDANFVEIDLLRSSRAGLVVPRESIARDGPADYAVCVNRPLRRTSWECYGWRSASRCRRSRSRAARPMRTYRWRCSR